MSNARVAPTPADAVTTPAKIADQRNQRKAVLIPEAFSLEVRWPLELWILSFDEELDDLPAAELMLLTTGTPLAASRLIQEIK
jgi:hypothetical protein